MAPTAAELLARLVVADLPRARGRFRCGGGMHVGLAYGGERPYLALTPDGAWFATDGDRVVVTDGEGLLRVTDGVRTVVRDADQGLVEVPRLVVGLGPERLMRPDGDAPGAASVGPTTWEGRPSWLLQTARRSYVVDDETAVVWRHEQRDAPGAVTGWAELVDLDLTTPTDVVVPDARPGGRRGPRKPLVPLRSGATARFRR